MAKEMLEKQKRAKAESEDEMLFALDQPAVKCNTCKQTSHDVDMHNRPGCTKLLVWKKKSSNAEFECKLACFECYPCFDTRRSFLSESQAEVVKKLTDAPFAEAFMLRRKANVQKTSGSKVK